MSRPSAYILGKRIARGGMAEIFLAKRANGQSGKKQIVAVKRILPHYASDAEFLEMFKHEAILSKSFNHANIVKVYDFCRVDGHFGIVMEFVPGTDLRSFLAQCEKEGVRLSVPMVVYIGICAAKGLHYAHSKVDANRKKLNIVHRDISPQNIILGFKAEVKVIDFGIANFESKSNETKPGIVKGKYSYMSPEQVSAKKADARSDVFSLAIVLWEALAMRRLFAGDTDVATIQNVQKATIGYSLRDCNSKVDRDLERILNKGLAREIDDRYTSADDFGRDLANYLSLRYPDFEPQQLALFASTILAERKLSLEQDIAALERVDIIHTPYAGTATNQSVMNQQTGNQQLVSGDAMGQIMHSPPNRGRPQQAQLVIRPFRNNAVQQKNRLTRQDLKRPKAPLPRYKITSNKTKAAAQGGLSLFLAATFTLVVGLGTTFYLKQQAVFHNMEFYIKTSPSLVQIKLNGDYLYQGKTVKTPLKMSIPPGKNELVIESLGFFPEIIRFEGKPSQKFRDEEIVLKHKNHLTPNEEKI